jgi:hypothetical protein
MANVRDRASISDEVIAPFVFLSLTLPCIVGVGGPLAHGVWICSSGHAQYVGHPRTWRRIEDQ